MRRFCPGCPNPLGKFTLKGRAFFQCADHGILAPAAVLPEFFKSADLAAFCLSKLSAPKSEMRESHRRCPDCSGGFFTFTAQTFAGVRIDVCQKCKVFWFDQGEWEAVKAGDLHAYAPAESAGRPRPKPVAQSSRDWIEITPGLGSAREDSYKDKYKSPALTFMFIGFSLLATAMARSHSGLFKDWVYWPQTPLNPLRHLSSLAVHADLLHWFGNAIFLWIAGDDVEDETSHWEFLKLFVLSGVAGHLTYSWIGAEAPSLGMSGAVSGLLAYYGIRFPHHRINTPKVLRWGVRFHFFTVSLSAAAFVMIYVVKNAIGFYLQTHGGGSGINYAAHVGGFAFGAIYALTRRD